jgi:uncharacterized membrane protein YoaK (UPF0700 family)
MSSERERALVPILLGLTVATGLVDAASVLGLGRVFTANMTGNVAFLGFAAVGTPGLSFVGSSAALVAFLLGALVGGRIGLPLGAGPASRPVTMAFGCEAALLLAATGVAYGDGADLTDSPPRLYAAIVLTGVAMGIRNAVVRKLAVPDLTTTVLTLTLTGLAADSPLAGSKGPRWGRRIASILCMFAGAAVGAWLVQQSVALTLGAAGVVSALCTLAAWTRLTRAEAQLRAPQEV